MRLDAAGCYLFAAAEESAAEASIAAEPNPASSAAIQGAGLLGLDRV